MEKTFTYQNIVLSFVSIACLSMASCGGGSEGNGGSAVVVTQQLNDTGIKLCGDEYTGSNTPQNNLNCSATGVGININGIDADGDLVPAGQDALYGRDANPATNSDADGVAGFSFTKLDANGNALAIQSGSWSDSGSESAGTKWSCVKDNVTGLIWEIKTNDGGLRDKGWTYSWYNSNGTTNGGSAGYADNADNCYVNTRCDTEKYVSDVNAVNLCGETANNWHLPSQLELLSIVVNDRVNPAVDEHFFANTPAAYFWSASPFAYISTYAWSVHFYYGYVYGSQIKYDRLSVRLVRGSN